MHPKEFIGFEQDFCQNDCGQLSNGHTNNHSAISHFRRNTKGFLLYALPLSPPPEGHLSPEMSDRKFMLSYFFMMNGSINLT